LRIFDKTWSTIISDYEPEESIQVYETTISSFQRRIRVEETLLSSLQGDNVCLTYSTTIFIWATRVSHIDLIKYCLKKCFENVRMKNEISFKISFDFKRIAKLAMSCNKYLYREKYRAT